jgi:hypothetical protein
MIETVFTLQLFAQANGAGNSTSWPDATIAATAIFTGVAMITAIVVVIVWQGLATWRSRMVIAREAAYQRLAEGMAETHQATLEELRKATADLADLRQRTAELERMLKEVE